MSLEVIEIISTLTFSSSQWHFYWQRWGRYLPSFFYSLFNTLHLMSTTFLGLQGKLSTLAISSAMKRVSFRFKVYWHPGSWLVSYWLFRVARYRRFLSALYWGTFQLEWSSKCLLYKQVFLLSHLSEYGISPVIHSLPPFPSFPGCSWDWFPRGNRYSGLIWGTFLVFTTVRERFTINI